MRFLRDLFNPWTIIYLAAIVLLGVIFLTFPMKARGQAWTTQGILVKDDGATKGYAKSIDCGANTTCTTDGFVMSISSAGGVGAAGLPADPAACASGQYVIDQDINGILACAAVQWSQLGGVPATFPPATHSHPGSEVTSAVATATALAADPAACAAGRYVTDINASGTLTCGQVAYSQISSPPTIPPNVAGAPIVTTAADATLTNEKVMPVCTGSQKLTHLVSGTITCGNDVDTVYTHPATHPATMITEDTTHRFVTDAEKSAWAVDNDTIYTLPAATDAVRGGIKVGSGLSITGDVLAKVPDVCTVPAATASVLGLVRGTGLSLLCSGTDKVVGFAADGTLQCGSDQNTGTYVLPTASAGTLGGIKVGSNLSIDGAGVLSASATPYTLPDATSTVTGGIRLTGDLGGTATSPQVSDNSHAHTTTTISGLDAGADFTAGTLPQARGGTGAGALTCTGSQKLTSNGTAYSCATDADTIYTHPTGDGNLHVPATGTTNSGKMLTAGSTAGSLSWANVDWANITSKPTTFPATTPVATATALAANPTDCAAGQYATTIDASGNLTCAQVAYGQISGTPAAYSLPTASVATLGGVKVGANLSIDGSGVLSAPAAGSKVYKDFNGDGRADQFWWNTSTGEVYTYFLNADGSTSTVQFAGSITPGTLVPTDFSDVSGDGIADVRWRPLAGGAELLWIMNSNGTINSQVWMGNTGEPWVADAVSSDWRYLSGKPSTFTPPIAAAGTLGGVKIGTGINVTGDGTISKVPDVCTAPPAATAAGLGLVRGTGLALTCAAGQKATGFAADGTLQCAADQTGAGAVYARYTRSTAQALNNGSYTLIDFNNKIEDTHNAVTTGASWRFTVPTGEGGLYQIAATVTNSSGVAPYTGDQFPVLHVNSIEIMRGARHAIAQANEASQFTAVVRLAQGNTVDLRLYQGGGGARSTEAVAQSNWITITKVGP